MHRLPDEISAKLERLRSVGTTYILLTTRGLRENLKRFSRDVMSEFYDKIY